MSEERRPPEAFVAFVESFPKLEGAWQRAREAENEGPLDEKTRRLAKLAIAVGAMRRGAVRSGVRKALAVGATPEELLQIVALAATTVGFPSAVAVHGWFRDVLEGSGDDGPAQSR